MTTKFQCSIEDFKSVLPKGLTLKEPLPQRLERGCLFLALDRRADPAAPVERAVRILEGENSAKWRKPLSERVQKLLGKSLPCVSTLLEVGADNPQAHAANAGDSRERTYLIHDRHPHSLAGVMLADTGLPSLVVLRIGEQVLTGLAALHSCGVSHGDLRRENVFLSDMPANGRFGGHAWIGETAIGGLAFWSGGEFRSDASYFPGEWGGVLREPSPKADLYALGVLLDEMALGYTQLEQLGEDPDAHKRRFGWQVRSLLAQRGVDGELRFLRTTLLADEEYRPLDAADALRRLGDHRKMKRRVLVGTSAMIVLIIVAAMGMRSSRTFDALKIEKQNLEAMNDMFKEEKNAVASEFTSLKETNQSLAEHNRELRAKLAICEGDKLPPEEQAAREVWKGALLPDDQYNFEKEKGRLVQLSIDSPPEQSPLVKKWLTTYRELHEKLLRWIPSDATIKGLLLQARRSPWDSDAANKVEARLAILEEAETIWREWAFHEKSNADLYQQLIGHKPDVQGVLKKWLDDAKHEDWWLRPKDGHAPDGYGIYRKVTITGSVFSDDWDAPTKHEYQMLYRFKWTKGAPAQLGMDYYTWWHWPTLIPKATFDGPLAIWQLNAKGIIVDENTGAWLTFEVVDCPGPPPNLKDQATRDFIKAQAEKE